MMWRARHKTNIQGRKRRRPDCERLESRALLTSITVTAPEGVTSAVKADAEPSVDLALTVTPGAGDLHAGSTKNFLIDVKNLGSITASNVSVTLSLPDNVDMVSFASNGSYSGRSLLLGLDRLAPGEDRKIAVMLRARDNTAGQSLDFSANLNSTTPDFNTSNDSANISIPILSAASNPHGNLTISGWYMIDESAGTATYHVIRQGGTSGTIQATFETFGGTAISGQDYAPVSQTITFADGETSKDVTIPLIGDSFPEDRTVGLMLTNVTGTDDANTNVYSSMELMANSGQTPNQLISPLGLSPAAAPVTIQSVTYGPQPRQVELALSSSIASTVSVSMPTTYELVWLGRTGRLGARGNRVLPISSALYDTSSNTITLDTVRRLPWRGRYGLIVNTTALSDLSGNPVQGNMAGQYVTTFGAQGQHQHQHQAVAHSRFALMARMRFPILHSWAQTPRVRS